MRLRFVPAEVDGDAKLLRRWGHSATVMNGIVVIFGGSDDKRLGDVLLIEVRRYRLSVRLGPSGPRDREKHAATLYQGGVIVCFGRRSPREPLGDAWIFDGQWREVQAGGKWPTPRWSHAVVAIDDRLLVVGGRNQRGFLEDGVYVLHNNAWTMTSSRFSVYGHACLLASDDNKILVFGGVSDEEKEASTTNPHIVRHPVDRVAHTAARLDDRHGVLIGGVSRASTDDVNVLIVDIASDDDDDGFIRKRPSPQAKQVLAATPQGCRPFPVHAQAVHLDRGLILVLGGGSPCLTFSPVFGDPVFLVDLDLHREF